MILFPMRQFWWTMLLRLLLFCFSFSVMAALRPSSSGSSTGRTSMSSPTTAPSSSSSLKVSSIAEASGILSQWDAQFLGATPQRVNSNTHDPLLRHSPQQQELYALLPEAVQYLNFVAAEQQQKQHRCILGICAETAEEGVQALSSWVTALQLPRGLVFGLDHDGVPITTSTDENKNNTNNKKKQERGIYLKYNSSFAKPRRRKQRKTTSPPTRRRKRTTTSHTTDPDEEQPQPPRPQQRDYQPGDVLASPYAGKYRGVYFQIELQDRTFRQYLLPANIF